MHGPPRQPARWLLLLVAVAMVAAGCDTNGAPQEDEPDADVEEPAEPDEPAADDEAAAEPEGEPVEGGTVIFGHEQEPAILNPFLIEGNLRATALVSKVLLLAAYEVTPDFEYAPQLLDGEAEVVEEDPFTVEFPIREEAAWSDGTPVTAEDFQFTLDTIMNPDYSITDRSGYDMITESEIADDKTIRFTFEEPFAPYRTLFGTEGIMPAHVLEGEDFESVWNDGIIDPATGEGISNGPFVFEEWDRGQQITVVRNENYWGDPPSLDRIVFRYIEETPTLLQQMRGGEIDIFDPQPQVDLLTQLEEIDGVVTQVDAGPVWEHITFNFDNEVLANDYVRQALIQGIDREAIARQLVGDVDPQAEVLQNPIYVNNQAQYEPTFDIWPYDPEAARALLEENGCTMDGNVYECPDGPLEFRYVGTAGNERRELMFEIVQAQLAEIGVALNADFSEPAVSLGEQMPTGDFDLVNFGWSGSPDPFGGNSIWTCGSREETLNYGQYCNEQVAETIQSTNTIIDPDERANAYNQAAELIAEDVPLIPMFQTPMVLAHEDTVVGPAVNPTQWTDTWNAGEWYLTE